MASELPWNNQFIVGKGVDSLSQQSYNEALEFDPPISESPGQRAIFRLETIESSRQLTQTLGISASASLSLGGFGTSAEFEMARSVEVNNFYTYALVRVLVLNPPRVLRNPRLKSAAQNKLEQQGWNEFAAAYGWEYIAGSITGGSFYGLIEIQTSTAKEQQNIKAELGASFGPFSASGEVTTGLQEAVSTFGQQIQVFRAGGDGAIPNTLTEMVAAAKAFPSTVQSNPVSVTALINDYRSSVPLPAVPPSGSLQVIQQRNTLEDLGREYSRLRDYKANLEFILSRSLTDFDEFIDLDQAGLQQKRSEFEASLNETATELTRITDRARRCYSDIGQCETYVSAVRTMPLPTIGGELMDLRQIEERVSRLETHLVPVRTIVPFYGGLSQAEALQPHGWWVCDGRTITDPSSPISGQPTPNMRDRFPRGSNSAGQQGGSDTVSIPDREVESEAWGFGAARDNIPAIGPKVGSAWGSFHPNLSRGAAPGVTVNAVPAYVSVIYLIKVR